MVKIKVLPKEEEGALTLKGPLLVGHPPLFLFITFWLPARAKTLSVTHLPVKNLKIPFDLVERKGFPGLNAYAM